LVAIHGCGGAGLSAVAIGVALGARVIAVDIRPEPLELAKRMGAVSAIDARETTDVSAAIREITSGGADLSLDTLGSVATLVNSIHSLRKQGRHVQVGHLTDEDAISSALVRRIIGYELSVVGSHGLQAHAYPGLLELIQSRKLDPMLLVDRVVPLEEAPDALRSMDEYTGCGVTIFEPNHSSTSSP
jgi:alcohol dehydrogenase